MADELETEETTGVDDYFSEHTELIDDYGNPLEAEKPVEKPDPVAAPNKPAVQPATGAPVSTAAPVVSDPASTIPDGFESRFFDKTEKGEQIFKADDAMKFLFPEGESTTRFKYQPIPLVAEDPAALAKPTDDTPAWKKQLEEEKTYRNNLKASLFTPLEHFENALKANYTPEQALAYAKQQSMAAFDEHITERQYEMEAKRREEIEKEGMTKGETAALQSKASSNEALFYNEVGGKEAFDQLLFGSVDKNGQPKPGVGSEDIWMMFKLANPDLNTQKLTGKQLNDKMASWWTRHAADKERLAFTMKVVKGTLFDKMRPYLIDKIRNTAQSQIASNREGNRRQPSGLSPAPKTTRSEQDPTVNAFFNPSASREGLATV